jgi:glutamate--cysteine ligase
MPKARYAPMRAYLPTRGARALDMMTMTATVQANYDWSDEDDVRRKMRMAMGVSPIVAAIYANSFLVNGRDSGFATFRYEVWRDVDPDRCGLLPFVFDDDFSYRRYVEWTLDVPLIFLRRGGRYLPANGVTFRRFWKEGLHGERATVGDYQDHLTTLFPEVRLKNVLEVRGADAGDPDMNAALPALWKGLLYDENACAEAWKLVARESFDERLALQRDVARLGLRAEVGGRKVLDLARELVGIAASGLLGTHCLDAAGRDERAVLEPLRPVLESGRTPADVWRERWHGELGRDPTKFVEAIAY